METEILYPHQTIPAERKSQTGALNILFMIAICFELLTPYLIWKNIIPSELRWVSQAAIALMLAGCLTRMIIYNHVPSVVWVIVGVSALWSFVALMRGQGVVPTIWGIWLLFQFPFVGLFIYLQPSRPSQLKAFLLKAGLIVLSLQVVVQLIQYATGEKIGDNLAGIFGRNGTNNAVFFVFIITCLFIGHWIVSKRWTGLLVTLILGAVSSAFGEVKLYPFIIAALSMVGVVLSAIRSHSLFKLLRYTVLVIGVVVVFMLLYNALVPSSARRPIQAFITDPQLLSQYLNQSNTVIRDGTVRTNMGRNFALSVGWTSLQEDPIILLFGYGIGARSESSALQSTGIGFASTDIGATVGSGTSLLIFMQEQGLVGLAVLGAFFIWVLAALIHDIRQYPRSPALELRYAVLLFTLFWPIWLWYSSVWHMHVSMLIYWMLLGYVLADARLPLQQLQRQQARLGLDETNI